MNKKGIKWLYQELPGLVARGVLNQETADKIQQYYGEIKSKSQTSVILITCGTIGALLIGLGIILLLAHNWEQFSRFTRAVLSFVPLIIGQGLALWVLMKRPQSNGFKEGAATFLSLMVGASIALISQTYNIPGDTGTFILTWMLLIFPLIYFMQASLPAVIYLIGITAWSGSRGQSPLEAVLFWPLAAVVVPHFIWALRREIYTIRTTLLSLVMIICVSCATGFSLVRAWPGFWVVLFPAIYAIFYYLGLRRFPGLTTGWQRPLRGIGGTGLFILTLMFTYRYIWEGIRSGYHFLSIDEGAPAFSFLPAQAIAFMLMVLAALFFYDAAKRKDLAFIFFGGLPLVAILVYALRDNPTVVPLLIFNAYLFVLSVSRIILGLRNNSLSVINAGMLMLAALILVRLFDSDIGFILKGLAFIILGAGFLAVNVSLVRRMGGAK